MKQGSLTIVGTGIAVGHLTSEARGWLTIADKVLYCVADAATERMILKINPSAESMYDCYGEDKQRLETYNQMVDRTMECVRQGLRVCVAYYGHPGFFVYPSHKAIAIAREEGFSAAMLPAVSCIDALFCDLGIDPAKGCQILEATDLMVQRRPIDVRGHVIILQVSSLGDTGWSPLGYERRKMAKHVPTLGEYLVNFYPEDFEIKTYHAAEFSVCKPVINTIKLRDLIEENMRSVTTLYIPPLEAPVIHLDMLDKYEIRHILDGFRLVPLNSRPYGEKPSATDGVAAGKREPREPAEVP